MMLRGLSLTLLCAGLLAHATAIAQAPKAWAYFAWWMPQSWRSAPLAQLDRLLFFELKVNAKGAISERQGWPDQWAELRAALKQSATPLDLTLTLFGKTTFDQLFSFPPAIQRLHQQVPRKNIAVFFTGEKTPLHDDSQLLDTYLKRPAGRSNKAAIE